jgi:hypothetical protein
MPGAIRHWILDAISPLELRGNSTNNCLISLSPGGLSPRMADFFHEMAAYRIVSITYYIYWTISYL